MRILSLPSLLPVFLTAAAAPSPSRMTAEHLDRNGAVVHGTGHARVTLDALVFQADEATLHSDTGEVELRGHVQVTLPARADRSVFRFRSGLPVARQPGALVTGDPVGLSAGRMTVKDGQLTASGNIVVRAVDGQVRGDELAMTLRTADATLSGHILATGKAEHEGQLPEMLPEIVK